MFFLFSSNDFKRFNLFADARRRVTRLRRPFRLRLIWLGDALDLWLTAIYRLSRLWVAQKKVLLCFAVWFVSLFYFVIVTHDFWPYQFPYRLGRLREFATDTLPVLPAVWSLKIAWGLGVPSFPQVRRMMLRAWWQLSGCQGRSNVKFGFKCGLGGKVWRDSNVAQVSNRTPCLNWFSC